MAFVLCTGDLTNTLVVHVVRVLRHPKLEDVVNHQNFQHLERRKLPTGHGMKQHPLRASGGLGLRERRRGQQHLYSSAQDIRDRSWRDLGDRTIPCIAEDAWLCPACTYLRQQRFDSARAFTTRPRLPCAHKNLIWVVLSVHQGSFGIADSLTHFCHPGTVFLLRSTGPLMAIAQLLGQKK